MTAVRVDPETARTPDGLPLPGTYLPWVITAGSYWRPGRWSFWCVHDPARAIVIDLTGDRYSRLVLQVDDPVATVAAIEDARRRPPV